MGDKVMSEFLRVFNYKKIIILLCLMLINLGLFSYINIPKSRNGLTEREIYTHEKYLEKYYDNINDVIKNADNLQKFSIFNKKKTFTYSNIIRTADDFKWSPLCSGHKQRNFYFYKSNAGQPAGCPALHFHG